MGHQERGAREAILSVEVLQGEQRGLVLGHQVVDGVVDLLHPRLQPELGRRRHHPARENGHPVRATLEKPVAGVGETGVDAEDPQARQPRWPP